MKPAMNWNQGTSSRTTIRTTLGGARPLSSASLQAKPAATNSDLVPNEEHLDVASADEKPVPENALNVETAQRIQGFVAINHDLGTNLEQCTTDENYPGSPAFECDEGLQTHEKAETSHNHSVERESPTHLNNGGAFLDLAGQEDDSAESGEVSEHSQDHGTTVVGESVPRDDDNCDREAQEDFEDQTDAMIDYSNSEQPIHESKETQTPEPPKTLADLNAEDLRTQLRYFYITRDPHTVPDTDPVRCLVCTKPGHMAGECPSLVCSTCGSYNAHFTHSCPRTQRCDRCTERGHEVSMCPYKLKPLNIRLICSLCEFEGHLEMDCELRWRTSGRPWETTLPALTVLRCCYECGGIGHLGNDCPTRMPGKPMGTSTWSEYGMPTSITTIRGFPAPGPKNLPAPKNSMGPKSLPAKAKKPQAAASTGSISIKGHAKRIQSQQMQSSAANQKLQHKLPPRPSQGRDVITISSGEEDDRAAFHRPPIHKPISGRQIRIATNITTQEQPTMESSRVLREQNDQREQRDTRDPRDQRDTRFQDYRDRDNYRERDDYRPSERNDYRIEDTRDYYRPYDNRRRSRSRSWSPRRRDDRRERPRFDAYRPMPSAAERAWKRGRM